MTSKQQKIAVLLAAFGGRELNANYLAYFECFNQQLFFEAHEVLEGLWLAQRGASNAAFFKGLIQLAGAFVHVQKARPGPAQALLKLARANLQSYPEVHECLDLSSVRALIEQWLRRLESGEPSALSAANAPRLELLERSSRLKIENG